MYFCITFLQDLSMHSQPSFSLCFADIYVFICIQAAKEFETELKKDNEDASNPLPPAESPKAVSSEDEKKELEASGTKESS